MRLRLTIFACYLALLASATLGLVGFAALAQPATTRPAPRPFRIYDSLHFWESKPLTDLPPAHVPNGDVGEQAVRKLAREASAAGSILVLDLETRGNKPLSLDVRSAKPDDVRSAMAYVLQRVRWARSERPGLTVAVYNVPMAATWELADPDRPWPDLAAWRQANEFLAPLVAECDLLCPSLYPMGMPDLAWVQSATGTMADCRTRWPGKPLVPFASPRMNFDDKTFVSAARQRLQLRTLAQHADGCVIWDVTLDPAKPDKAGVLDISWPWWTETQRFVSESR